MPNTNSTWICGSLQLFLRSPRKKYTMVRTTMVARVSDGLPLSASMDDEQVRTTPRAFGFAGYAPVRDASDLSKTSNRTSALWDPIIFTKVCCKISLFHDSRLPQPTDTPFPRGSGTFLTWSPISSTTATFITACDNYIPRNLPHNICIPSPYYEKVDNELSEYKSQAKLIFRRLNMNSEPRCSIETGNYILQ